MGRPLSDLGDYQEWQGRLERYGASELDLGLFCLQEGVSRSTFYRWKKRLKDGIPESIESPATLPDGVDSGESVFVPLSFKATPVEIELRRGWGGRRLMRKVPLLLSRSRTSKVHAVDDREVRIFTGFDVRSIVCPYGRDSILRLP